MLTSAEDMSRYIHKFWKAGFQTVITFLTSQPLDQLLTRLLAQNIHCIGDRANQVVLDILEDIFINRGGNVTDWRPRIEHAQIFSPEDLKRMGRLGGKLRTIISMLT
jgi:predicted amidohydrolase YtcJ